MSTTATGAAPNYFVPQPSRHPAFAAFGLFWVILGAAQWINGNDWGKYALFFGLFWLFGVLFQWFRQAIGESEGGNYNHQVDLSFRWSMSWFIFSEVMFFGAFFTALWWMRSHSVPALGGLDNALLWPDFKAVWPSVAPGTTASPAGIIEPFQVMTPFWMAAHHQHGPAAVLGRHPDHRPPCVAPEPAWPHHRLHVGHGAAGRDLRRRAGL